MQTAQKIIDQMRRIAKVDSSQYTDANALIDLNTLKDEFWSAIVTNVQERYNWEKWKTDLVALQSEYTLATVAYNTSWTKLLNSVSINYDWETYTNTWELKYIKCTLKNPDTLENDWDYYVENQSETDPIYYVADNSYFIAPAPITAVTNWIKLSWIRKIPDYSLTTTEADMKIPVDQQQALVYWLVVHWLMNKWTDDWTINNAESRWERKKAEAIRNLETRIENPIFLTYPDTINDDEIIITTN